MAYSKESSTIYDNNENTEVITTTPDDVISTELSTSITWDVETISPKIFQLITAIPFGVLTFAGLVVVISIFFIGVVTLVLSIYGSRRKGILNIRKKRKELARKPLPLTPRFSEHTYESPQPPEGSVRVIQAVSRSSLQKRSLISRNGYVCRWKGTLTNDEGTLSAVVISTINERINRERLRWNDCCMQSIGLPQHQNILNIIGYVFHKDRLHVVHGYQSNRNLQGFLEEMYVQDCLDDSPLKIIPSTFISFATGIVDGVDFLSSNGLAHPGLSARKVLLSGEGVCKLYDLCLMDVAAAKACRYVLNSSIRYLPPETVFQTNYTQASDVWGVGIVLWQIFSYGKEPFEGLEVREFKLVLKRKLRLPKPSNCPNGLFSLICDMWAQLPTDRLLMYEIKVKLQNILAPPTAPLEDNNGSDLMAVNAQYDTKITVHEEFSPNSQYENEVESSEEPHNSKTAEELDITAVDECPQTAVALSSGLESSISELESQTRELLSERSFDF